VRAEVLTIGDELLRGEIVDSNKSFLSERLLALDVETRWHVSVSDDPDEMEAAFRQAASRSDVVLVSGGLGPTRDDLTTAVLARTFDRSLVEDAGALDSIRSFFSRIGREMSPNNRKQALFPEEATVLPNPEGTAPGFALEAGETVFFCLPGVPRELRRMMDEQVLPRVAERLAARTGGPARTVVRARLLRTFGIGESSLDAELADVVADPAVSLGFRTAFPDNLLRPVARGRSVEEAEALLDATCRVIRERLGALVYAEIDEPMEAVVVRALGERGVTLATAESCTGGLVAERVTAVPGSSAVFLGGAVAYANSAKQALLGVPEEMLREHGAVSDPVARAMAEGARSRFGADLAVSTTGISGPGGGSEEKPVGLVHVALADAAGTHAEAFVFPLDRERHRVLTAQVALDWVRRRLLDAPLEGPTLLRRRGGGSAPASVRPTAGEERA